MNRSRRLRRNRAFVVGGAIILFFIATSIVVSVASLMNTRITPYDPIKQNVGPALAPPTLDHFFGTDNEGRDVFSRVIAATPNDVFIGFAVILVAFSTGLLVGAFAAFRGGLLDEALMRVTDIFFALPALILALAISVALGPGLLNMTLALMIIWWPPYARLARGESLKIAHQNYIEAAAVSGFGTTRIIFRHVIPNIFITMLVYSTLDLGTVIIVYSGLSYLGLAVTPPAPDWGQMVAAYQDYILSAPWLPVFPGLIIALGVIGFSILGDGLRDIYQVG
jgi:peptide/nickel transport system permease protein